MTNREKFRAAVLLILDTLPDAVALGLIVHGGDTRTTLHWNASSGKIDETGYDVKWASMTYGGRDFPDDAGPAYIAESVMRSAMTKSTRSKIEAMARAETEANMARVACEGHAPGDGRQS